MCGLKRGVGAETLSEFFGRLRLEAHIGCSPSALRRIMEALEAVLLETTATWEQEGVAAGELRPIIGAVDETFLTKVRTQLAGVAALVDVWWQKVWYDVESQVGLTPSWRGWVAECVLPLMYWQEQLARPRCPRRKAKLLAALKGVEEAMATHSLTPQLAPEVLAGWKVWAAEHARGFQRASSAVEGRNGTLSQLHYNQRGVPTRRYKVWTVLHNFDCRAADGSTPASRFFRHAFPDLFETVLSKIDDVPRSRQRHQALAINA